MALAWVPAVEANPTGAQVAAGAASFNTAGRTLTVTNTPGTIINWQSFSIGAGSTTHFQQQSSLSAVLNRVVGSDASQILGTLSSNGRVFLVNPHGIVFGQGAVINTAGLVASTLNMRDEDFLAGRMKFEGGGLGALRNEGAIRASGDIFLVGPQVENAGLIKSDNGSVVLAAGKSLTISSPDAQGVQFALQAPTDAALNIGAIEAKNAAAMFAGTLRHSGEIRATSASVDASGRVILAAQKDALVDGNTLILLDNLSGRGGRVEITGERVGLFDNATISARGVTGGGEILIGGDYRGANPAVRNAQMTHIASGVTLDAGASSGSGGRVIVWADDSTRAHGRIITAGGEGGGFIETSGKRHLDVGGIRIDAGRGGQWLLDPYNIEVVAGSGLTNNSGATAFTPGGDDSQIGADLIVAQLDAGTSVTLDTAGAGTQAGNIVINAPIVKTANNAASLTLTANNDITVNQNIRLSNNDIASGTTSGVNATFNATAGGVFAVNDATVEAWNINVNAASISRSGTQTNDFVFGFSFPFAGALNLTTQSGGVGSLANPIRFASPDHAGRTWSVNTVNAGAAGHIYLQPTRNEYGTFGGSAIQTDPATTQTVYLNHSGAGAFSLMGNISGNDNWTLITGGSLNTCSFGGCSGGGFKLTANTITATAVGGISAAGTFSSQATFDTSAANGSITLTAGAFDGTGCGGINFGVGVQPGTGTVSATSTGIPSCGGAIQLVHYGGDLLTSRYQLNFIGVNTGLDNLIRLKARDGHLIIDGTAGMGASTQNKGWELSTLTANKDIVFSGGTITGNRVYLKATRDIDSLAAGTTSWREICVTSGCSWKMEAGGGIGLTNPIRAEADWVGELVSGAAGAMGDINVNFTAAPATPLIATVSTAAGSAQNIRINTAGNLNFSPGQPGFGGAFSSANDHYTINVGGTMVFTMWNNTASAASFDLTAAGSVVTNSCCGTTEPWISTTGALSITSTGGSIGESVRYANLPTSGGMTLSALNNVYVDAGTNPLSLAGITTGTGAGTIGLRNSGANDITIGGTTSINDNLIIQSGQNIIFPAAANFSTSGGLTLNSPTQIAATATVAVAGVLGGSGAMTNAGTLIKSGAGAGDFSGGFANSGTVSVSGGTLGLSGGYTDSGGALVLGGGTVTAPAAGLVFNTGQLRGSGTVTGNVTHNGTLSVGSSPGTMSVTGNLTLGAGSNLNIELGGTTQGVNYDLLQVTGTANLNGTMNVTMFGGFTGAAGNIFDVLTYGSRTGNFTTVNFPAGYGMTATPNATFYQLALSSLPAVSSSSNQAAILKLPASEARILNDKFLGTIDPGKQPEDEERKGAVLECK